jgi:hypothetical protein
MAGSIGASLAVGSARRGESFLVLNILLSWAPHPGRETWYEPAEPPPQAGKAGDPMASIVIIGLVIFFFGAAIGGILIVSLGIQREERNFSLTRQAPGQVSRGPRRVTGLYVRHRTDLSPPLARREDTLV